MITFNREDDNIADIEKLINIPTTKYNYRVFGMVQDDSPPIGIRYNMDEMKCSLIENPLRKTIKKYNLSYPNTDSDGDKERNPQLDFEHHDDKTLAIALRRDIRENKELCAEIIKEFISNFERLSFQPTETKSRINSFFN